MKGRSLRTQLGMVFIGFLFLVIGSVTVTVWLMQTQQHDSLIINLAGRQRMLAQQMMRLALTDPDNPELGETIDRFERTLTALSVGGTVIDSNGRPLTLPPPTHPDTISLLGEIAVVWPNFQGRLYAPIENTSLQTEFETLILKLDAVVSTYEMQARAKINRLRWAQFIFLAAAFLLSAWGYRVVHRHFIQPLTVLDRAAQEFGRGHLDTPVPQLIDNEMGRLGQTMETMRDELAVYQNALAQQVAQRTQELTTAFAFSQEIVRELEPSQLLASVTNHIRDLMQGESVSVCVLDREGRSLELIANSGADNGYLGLRQSTERGIALPVIQEHKTVIQAGGCANCAFLQQFPEHFCAAAPLQVGGRCLGALCVIRSQPPFSRDEARALTLLSNAAAIALENARLIAASKQQAEENASLAERERLAANLHDNLAQNLGAMHLSVDALANDFAGSENELAQQRIGQIQNNLKQAYAQVRMALTGLREPMLEVDEFITNIQALVADFESQTGLSVQFIMDEGEAVRLTAVAQKQALHIMREALTNIRRHAQATQVQLTMTQDKEKFTLEIVDNGIGFDANQVSSRNHLGLSIMRTRAERSQGELSVRSAPGQGTHITVTFLTCVVPEPELEVA